ncbi:MAG: MBOAT family O-acyltransferase [Bacteroidia bacterium]
MVFSSNFFLLTFLPLFLLAYYTCPAKFKNIVFLIASLFFYAWGAPKFIFVLLFSLFLDFYLVRFIYKSEGKTKKYFLSTSVFLSIALLAYFKYANFFVENINLLASRWGANGITQWTDVALPIGISFITFHKLTYAVDAYRNVHKPLEKFSDYVLYILMFPHQIAGPIVRFNEIADQIENRERQETIDNRLDGMFRFIIGLSKKVIIANCLGTVASHIFDLKIGDISTSAARIGILAYTFQIYFDFSGYSDMAIGLAKMLGFIFPENFNLPYVSGSITEFWRRWHITLGRFMKDYLYIPLGGNKVSKLRLLLNLWIVFLISGLWHGASWTFVIWGAYHGFLLILDRLFFLRFLQKIFQPISIMITFFLVLLGWVFFKSPDLHFSFGFIGQLFSFSSHIHTPLELSPRFWFMLFMAIVFSFYPLLTKERTTIIVKPEQQFPKTVLILKATALLLLLIICISDINGSDFNPFIYFRF